MVKQKQKTVGLLLGTHNKGKIKEFQQLFSGSCVHLLNQDAPDFEPAEEIGLTFVENAVLKARHACEQTGLPSLADDSGLMVSALGGAPGLYSARYCGEDASSAEKCQGIIRALNDLEKSNPHEPVDRDAKFVCVLALIKKPDDPDPIICRAEWSGIVTRELTGTQGFGYDPIVYIPDQRCTVAELSPEKKSLLSHRGKAVQCLLAVLSQGWGDLS